MKRTKQPKKWIVQWTVFLIIGGLFFSSATAFAIKLKRKKPASSGTYIEISKKERCPVCGMFVRPYPKWITQVQHKDGSHHSFDGMKCMVRYYLDVAKFDPDKKPIPIKRVLVRDYYTLKFIPHHNAFYVVGSDVLGPMGHELIPFEEEKRARIFLDDHKGIKILRFEQITSDLLDKLDRAKKTLKLD